MTTILVADDHGFIRAGVSAVLHDSRFHVVAATASGKKRWPRSPRMIPISWCWTSTCPA
jgi:CheY-like chemotaxis protein